MKKEYISPRLDAVIVQATKMMATSMVVDDSYVVEGMMSNKYQSSFPWEDDTNFGPEE